jgi:hypothetical protein
MWLRDWHRAGYWIAAAIPLGVLAAMCFTNTLFGWNAIGDRVLVAGMGVAFAALAAGSVLEARQISRMGPPVTIADLVVRPPRAALIAVLALGTVGLSAGVALSGPLNAAERARDLDALSHLRVVRLVTADSFSGAADRWPTVDDGTVSGELRVGSYVVAIRRGGEGATFARDGEVDASVRVAVEMTADGAGSVGVVCNFFGNASGIFDVTFRIYTDGRYEIVKRAGTSDATLVRGRTTSLDARPHAIVATCLSRNGGPIGAALALDGTELGRGWSPTGVASSGRVGLVAGAITDGFSVVYTHLRVEEIAGGD